MAYQRIVGMAGPTPPAALDGLAARRTSVNDLLRTQMQRLLARRDLSAADPKRLDQHFTAIRDIETKITGQLPPDKAAAIAAGSKDPLNPVTTTQS